MSAGEIAAPAARLVKGGAAKNPEFVQGGGKDAAGIDDALVVAQREAARARRGGPSAGAGTLAEGASEPGSAGRRR